MEKMSFFLSQNGKYVTLLQSLLNPHRSVYTMKKALILLLAAALATTVDAAPRQKSKAKANRSAKTSRVTNYNETYTVGGQRIPAIRNRHLLKAIPPGTPIMPPNAAAARDRIGVRPLNFNGGQAHISGSIRGLGIAAYSFSGSAGQSIRMVPNGKNFAMEFALFNPQMGMRFGSVHTLPYSGEYEVRIVQNHKNAARSKTARPYNVTVYLDGAADGMPMPVGQRSVPMSAAPMAMDGNEPMPVKRGSPMRAAPAAAAMPAPEMDAEPEAAPAPRKAVRAPAKGKGKSRNYQCENGAKFSVEYLNINTPNPTAVVHSDSGDSSLPLDTSASSGKNLIFSSDEGMLHLVKTQGNNLARAEVLSFDHNGSPIGFGCKPR